MIRNKTSIVFLEPLFVFVIEKLAALLLVHCYQHTNNKVVIE